MQDTKEYTIWDGITPKTITSSTDASPVVVTLSAHGFSTGDLVMIYGHATNIAINGIFRVVKINANTFSLVNYNTGVAINGSGAGAGSGGVIVPAPKILLCSDFKSIQFELMTSSSASLTLQILGSFGKKEVDAQLTQGDDTPIFGATQAEGNPWGFVQVVDLDSGSGLAGATGVVLAGTDVSKMYEANVNSAKYITFAITAYSAGKVSLKAKLFNGLQV